DDLRSVLRAGFADHLTGNALDLLLGAPACAGPGAGGQGDVRGQATGERRFVVAQGAVQIEVGAGVELRTVQSPASRLLAQDHGSAAGPSRGPSPRGVVGERVQGTRLVVEHGDARLGAQDARELPAVATLPDVTPADVIASPRFQSDDLSHCTSSRTEYPEYDSRIRDDSVRNERRELLRGPAGDLRAVLHGEGLGESLVVCLLRPLGADLQAGLLEHHPDLAGRQAVRLPDLALVLPRGALAAALLAGPSRRRRDVATGPVDLVHARGDGVLSALAPHPRGVRELVGG